MQQPVQGDDSHGCMLTDKFQLPCDAYWQTDGDDRPRNPPVITGAEVIWNPFDDIVPRITPEEKLAAAAAQRSAACPCICPCALVQARS